MNTLKIERDARGVAMVAFNRPEVHNAFDETMIREVIEAFRDLGEDESVRAIIIDELTGIPGEELISKEITVDDVDEAFADMQAGTVARSVIRHQH